MRDTALDQAITLAAAKGAATAATLSAVASDSFLAGFGVPLHVLLMGATGSLMALAYTKPQQGAPRLALLSATVACAAVGAGVAIAVPHVPGMAWTAAIPAPVRSLLAAFACQFALPLAINELPALVTRIRERLGGK